MLRVILDQEMSTCRGSRKLGQRMFVWDRIHPVYLNWWSEFSIFFQFSQISGRNLLCGAFLLSPAFNKNSAQSVYSFPHLLKESSRHQNRRWFRTSLPTPFLPVQTPFSIATFYLSATPSLSISLFNELEKKKYEAITLPLKEIQQV